VVCTFRLVTASGKRHNRGTPPLPFPTPHRMSARHRPVTPPPHDILRLRGESGQTPGSLGSCLWSLALHPVDRTRTYRHSLDNEHYLHAVLSGTRSRDTICPDQNGQEPRQLIHGQREHAEPHEYVVHAVRYFPTAQVFIPSLKGFKITGCDNY